MSYKQSENQNKAVQTYLRSIEIMEEARDKDADILINGIRNEAMHTRFLCDSMMELHSPDVEQYDVQDVIGMGVALVKAFRMATDLARQIGGEADFKSAVEDFIVAED